MTQAKTLERLVCDGNARGCVELFAEMPEEERRSLAPHARRLLKESWQALEDDPNRFSAKANSTLQEVTDCAARALWATASPSEMKKLGWRARPGRNDEDCLRIMANRRPAWLQDWCAWLLEEWPFCWTLVRQFVKQGLCDPPETDGYVLGMLACMGTYSRDDRPIAKALESERDLLEGLFWRLFEVEGGGDLSLAACDKYCAPEHGWTQAILDLAARGVLDRNRLLDASLDALNRDFAQFRAGWFSRLHEALQPNLEERAARVGKYLDLLASPIPPTVSFAMKACKLLQAKGKLPANAFLGAVEPTLYAKSKSTAGTALKIIAALAKKEKAQASRAASLAAIGLEHESGDLQEQALLLIEGFGDPGDGTLRQDISSRLNLVSASLRPRLENWLGTPAAAKTEPYLPAPGDDGDIAARAACLDPKLSERAGLPALLAEFEKPTGTVPAVAFDGTEVPRLAGRAPLQAVESVEELIDLLLHAIEHLDDPDLQERALDGLARLSCARPANFGRLIKPLAKRLEQVESKIEQEWTAPYARGQHALLLALDAWLNGSDLPLRTDRKSELYYVFEREERLMKSGKIVTSPERYGFNIASATRTGLLLLRGFLVAEMVRSGLSAPLLSSATHCGGWIAPVVLIERAKAWLHLGRIPALADLVLAILRLAPDRRPEALAAAKQLPGEWGEAIRYALGGSENIGRTAPLWVAACRARAPFADDPLVGKAFPKLGPGGGITASYSYRVEKKIYEDFSYHTFEIEVTPPHETRRDHLRRAPGRDATLSALSYGEFAQSAVLLPTVDGNLTNGEDLSALACTLWPLNCEACFAAAALDSFGHEETIRPAMAPVPASFQLFLDPDLPLTSMARLSLCQGLNARDATEGQMASDALIACIEDGRVAGPELGETLCGLLASGIIRPKRWIPRLKAVASESLLHAQVLRAFLETALAGDWEAPPRDIAAFYELLLEICVESREAIASDALRRFLDGLSGSGKTRKLAKQLLELEAGNNRAIRRAAVNQALTFRIARVERWQGSKQKVTSTS
jgi:hypothetical protein